MYKGKMYLYGGNSGLKTNETFYAFDPSNNTWEIIRHKPFENSELHKPPACDEHTAVVHQDTMVLFGGFIEGDRVNSVYKFSFKTGEWRLIQYDKMVLPCARAGHSATADDHYMYIFGGKNNEDEKLNDLWRFDLIQETWEKMEPAAGSDCPIARQGHTSAIYNGYHLVFGGIYETTRELNDCYIFNLKT